MNFIRRFLHYTTLSAVLVLPIFLTHFRGIADGLISYVAICFLFHCFLEKEWEWSKQLWVMFALVWWGWLVICTIPFGSFFGETSNGNLLQAMGVIRFPIFVIALQQWVLKENKYRRWLAYIIAFCTLYILLNMLAQLIIGYNILGMPRYFDGTLTGPYEHPRAAAPLSRMLLPVMLAVCAYLIWQYKGYKGQLYALFTLLFAVAMMVMAGQRMPFGLFIMGLGIAVIWLKPLRILALVTVGVVPIIILITAFISPESFNHLVTHFIDQMSHFSSSPYGLVYTRAVVMGAMNPWAGLGYDAFKHACGNAIYFHGWPFWDINSGNGGGGIICLTHPHNHYLQAFIDAGILGLILFILTIISALVELCKGLNITVTTKAEAIRKAWCVGLFAAVFIHEWPFASTSNFVNMPLGGWFFLLLGMGLAYSWDYQIKLKEREDQYVRY
ncbi:O-antigen ligase [Commensalibacter papalotli (ex Botero et al. 2024)]|uniref:O-antigen ligase (RfaL) n=1 Tax=Commensalibacter papalotli (ex Botero et al. 2024) TaxID=2972766 RepID=A0ABM9HLL9_9PROT|nr:O-antigen ligase family protein [Commensalibacter papalotli (ex Botero et al. 2024)]CAI3933002.1 O-antigen ligase (RfaL) [Commensalibacter papalotli (ex Botero et al. 2024)]CAI3949019.1 O-antigen ligase (RfaL) [Commensalibacter papalotli (ex Botero et al. 2024)]